MKTVFTILISILVINTYGQFNNIELDDSSFGNYVTQVEQDENGLYFLSRGEKTISALSKDDDTWTVYGKDNYDFYESAGAPDNFVVGENGLYILWRGEVDLFNGTDVHHLVEEEFGFRHNYVQSLIDIEGTLFIGYFNGFGVSLYSEGEWIHRGDFPEEYGLLNEIFNLSYMSLVGDNIWIYDGTFSMYQVDIENDEITKHDLTSLSSSWQSSTEITGSTVDAEDKVYFSTELGLLKFDGSDWSIANKENANLPFENLGFVEVYKGKTLTGGKEGIFTIDGEVVTSLDHNNSNYPEFPPYIYDSELYNGKVYLGTGNNLIVWDLEMTSKTNETTNEQQKLQYQISTNTISWDVNHPVISHSVLDINGRVILHSDKANLSVNYLQTGIYISRLVLSTGKVYSDKFVKM